MRHNESLVIENASIVTPEGILENASIRISNGIIEELCLDRIDGCDRRIDAGGRYVLPGLVDLHSDAIENEIEPRKGAVFPVNMAIFDIDKKLAASGITTVYHSISLIDSGVDTRDKDAANRIIREITRLASQLNVRTRVHARFDIQSTKAIPYVERLIDDGCVHLFSIMDHTPGQGQFRKITAFMKDYMEKIGRDVTGELPNPDGHDMPALSVEADFVERLVKKCHDRNIPVASHDDDSDEKLDVIERMGIVISEFPVNMEAVASATTRGMFVALGAPNIVRGNSINGNLSARETIAAGFGDIICSDYVPTAIIHAVFTMEGLGVPLHRAVNMASLNPAKAAGIADITGSLEPGKSADLIIVDTSGEVLRVLKTFVEGTEVYSTWY